MAERFRTSLRFRIIIALVLIVTLTSALFGTGVLTIKEKLEEVIFGEMVQDELQDLLDRRDAGTYRDDILFQNWQFYFGDVSGILPEQFLGLEPGSYHSVRVGERYYQVEVADHKGERVYLSYDITDWERQEHEVLGLLVWGIVLVLLAAILMGWQASRAILAPVRALTGRLAGIQPHERQVRIAREFSGNEIGEIARAFDQYLARLDNFVERERSFTAAASHELRTPLSVMLGAVDILEAQTSDATALRALSRIRRACGEMQAFIEASLLLAREENNTIEQEQSCSLCAILRTLCEDAQAQLEQRNISLQLECKEQLPLPYPRSLVQIVVGNILRNAMEHTSSGRIDIHADSKGMSISDSGAGIAAADLPRVFDHNFTTKADGTGMGLNLVRRICDRFGWTVSIDSTPAQGTTVRIDFTTGHLS